MPYGDMMRQDCSQIKRRQNVRASVAPTRNADLLTTMKSVLVSTVVSPITPKMKLGVFTKKAVNGIGTIMKLKWVGISH